jgi:hypothetical protein
MTNVFATIRRFGRWLWAHWYIPLALIAAVAGWLVGSTRKRPRETIADELDAIDQAEKIERFAIEKGATLANQAIDHQYRRTLQQLDDAQKRKADVLRSDPGRRVRYLRRLADSLGDGPANHDGP